jgi:hypothetical protein
VNRSLLNFLLLKVSVDDNHRILRAAHGFNHVQIPIRVTGIKRLHRNRDENLALPGVAGSLSFRVVTHTINLVHGVRHVITQRALAGNPLLILLRNSALTQEQRRNAAKQ